MYKVGDYQFKIEELPLKEFNEVSNWLKANYFQKCQDIFEMKQIRTLKQMIQQVHRTDLEQLGLETKEIDRFMNLIDLMKRNTKINIQMNTNQNAKKMLMLKFIAGPLQQEILLDPDNMPI